MARLISVLHHDEINWPGIKDSWSRHVLWSGNVMLSLTRLISRIKSRQPVLNCDVWNKTRRDEKYLLQTEILPHSPLKTSWLPDNIQHSGNKCNVYALAPSFFIAKEKMSKGASVPTAGRQQTSEQSATSGEGKWTIDLRDNKSLQTVMHSLRIFFFYIVSFKSVRL